jgi:hypothetical protein
MVSLRVLGVIRHVPPPLAHQCCVHVARGVATESGLAVTDVADCWVGVVRSHRARVRNTLLNGEARNNREMLASTSRREMAQTRRRECFIDVGTIVVGQSRGVVALPALVNHFE